jgi:glycosyltransferase involved in cell wall biosynthesis
MIVGGAQENTLFNCLDLIRDYGDQVVLVTGPTEGAEGKLLDVSAASGLEIRQVDSLRRSIHPVHDLQARRDLTRLLREMQPDVVHTHSAKAGMLGRAAAWKCRTPAVIHTVHGAPFHPYQSWVARRLFQQCERWAARRCHHMISVADAMTDLMVDAGVATRDKFTTIYSGMDVEPLLRVDEYRAAMRAELGFSPKDIVFGKLARLFHLKGHEYVVRAAQLVANRVPHAKFLFVGDGLLRSSMEERISKMGLSDRFVFTGLVSPEQVPRYIGAMDALIHTSLREGLARAIPQALIAGRPVISYDIDGAREVVIPGETGFLIEPCAIEPLAQAIESLANTPSLRSRYGAEGRLRFTEQFRHQTMTKTIRDVYTRILRGE